MQYAQTLHLERRNVYISKNIKEFFHEIKTPANLHVDYTRILFQIPLKPSSSSPVAG